MKKEKNILDFLFICIVINLIPTMLLEVAEIPSNIYTILNGAAFFLQTIILIVLIRKEILLMSKKEFCLLAILLCSQIITQLINLIKFNSINIEDVINIISVTINIIIFVITIPKCKIENKNIISFMNKITNLAFVACIYNIIVNGTKMLNLSTLTSSYSASFSSFFPNRNQFGIFLIISIISNLYLTSKKGKKWNNLLQVIFIANLILTMSRNSILCLIIIYFIKFYSDYKNGKIKKNSFIKINIILLVFLVGITYIFSNQEIFELLNKLFFRTDNLDTGSGRFTVWKNGIEIAINNNIISGVGRFKALDLNKSVYSSNLQQFHSTYVEIFAGYGIIGLIYFIGIIKKIFSGNKKISKNNQYSILISITTFAFLTVSIFESITRFSIGYADTISIIYFICIPLTYINNYKNDKL